MSLIWPARMGFHRDGWDQKCSCSRATGGQASPLVILDTQLVYSALSSTGAMASLERASRRGDVGSLFNRHVRVERHVGWSLA